MADGYTPDLKGVFADPEFRALAAPEKIKILKRVDPEFGNLPLQDQVSAISTSLVKIRPKGEAPAPGFFSTLGDIVKGTAQTALQAGLHPYETFVAAPERWEEQQTRKTVEAFKKGQIGQAGLEALKGGLGETGTAIAGEQAAQFPKAVGRAKAGGKAFGQAASSFVTGQPLKAMEQAEAGEESLRQAGGYALAGALPIVGPAAAESGEEFYRGEYGPAFAHALALLGPDLAGMALGAGGGAIRRSIQNALKSNLTPEQAARYAEAEARRAAGLRTGAATYTGPLLTKGEQAGSRPIMRMERTAQATPGAAAPAEEMYTGRGGELERQAQESIEKIAPAGAPGPLDEAPVDLGRQTYGEAGRTMDAKKGQADIVYRDVRRRSAKDTQEIVLGSRQLPDGTWVPIKGTYQAPVPLKPLRASLRSLYQQFRSAFKDLDESQRMANPGYRSLHNIMTDVDELTPGKLRQYMSAMDLDAELSAIKQSLRDRRFSDFLHSPSGRVQLRIINNAESMLARALNKAEPGLYSRLLQGRQLVKEYKAAGNLLKSIVGKGEAATGIPIDPKKLYTTLTGKLDSKIGTIEALAKLAPDSSKQIWRTYMEGMLQKVLDEGKGKLELGAGNKLLDHFNKLGGKTKLLAFGPKLTKELENLFKTIKDLYPREGSPTAYRLPAVAAMGAGFDVLMHLAGFHFKTAATMVGKIILARKAANILSRMWFAPGGAAATTRLLRNLTVGGAGLREAARVFGAYEANATREERENSEQQRRAKFQPQPAPGQARAAAPGEDRWQKYIREHGLNQPAGAAPAEGEAEEPEVHTPGFGRGRPFVMPSARQETAPAPAAGREPDNLPQMRRPYATAEAAPTPAAEGREPDNLPQMRRPYETAEAQPTPEAGRYEGWRAGLPRNLQSTEDYDLRGAYEAGVQPGPEGHLPDTFKKPNHMTFSDESRFNDPAIGQVGGHWQDNGDGSWTFYASPTNLIYHSPEELQDYFEKYEPGNRLVLPQEAEREPDNLPQMSRPYGRQSFTPTPTTTEGRTPQPLLAADVARQSEAASREMAGLPYQTRGAGRPGGARATEEVTHRITFPGAEEEAAAPEPEVDEAAREAMRRFPLTAPLPGAPGSPYQRIRPTAPAREAARAPARAPARRTGEMPRGEQMVDTIAQAISQHEGRATRDRNHRNNNPGNLTVPPHARNRDHFYHGQTGLDGRFAKFKDYQSGLDALKKQIRINLRRGLTLDEFFAGEKRKGGYPGYAPKTDYNDPEEYAAFVAKALGGIDTGIPLSGML